MPNVAYDELRERRTKAQAEAQALVALAESEERDFTDEEQASFTKLCDEVRTLDNRMERLEKINSMAPPAVRKAPPEPIRQPGDPAPIPREEKRERTRIEIPSNIRRGALNGFTKERFGDDHEYRAYRFGRSVYAALGHERSRQWCKDQGLELRVHTEGTNWAGGFLVPEGMDSDIIRLVEDYGVFRQYARVVPMTSDTSVRNRRSGGLTVYFANENTAGTESSMTWDQIQLVAKKMIVLATMSSELSEDAIISVSDALATEIAYAFANKEDECGFNGDGTSTYGGIVGVRNAFTNLTATIANISGLVVGAGNAYSELTLANFNDVVSKLPAYADTPNARWFVHKTFFGTVMQKLAYAAGGNTTGDITSGTGTSFLGYPVVFSQVMPKAEANSQVCAVLGDLSLAADFGDRRGISLAFSDSAYVGSTSMFAADSIAVRGTERFDINVHDVGDQNATAASRNPGPVVGLITAAS